MSSNVQKRVDRAPKPPVSTVSKSGADSKGNTMAEKMYSVSKGIEQNKKSSKVKKDSLNVMSGEKTI